jgi:hypothetical protein
VEKTNKPMSPKDWRKALKAMEKLPPPMIEEKTACYHLVIEKVIADSVIY